MSVSEMSDIQCQTTTGIEEKIFDPHGDLSIMFSTKEATFTPIQEFEETSTQSSAQITGPSTSEDEVRENRDEPYVSVLHV
jgi:hypothetical protein